MRACVRVRVCVRVCVCACVCVLFVPFVRLDCVHLVRVAYEARLGEVHTHVPNSRSLPFGAIHNQNCAYIYPRIKQIVNGLIA